VYYQYVIEGIDLEAYKAVALDILVQLNSKVQEVTIKLDGSTAHDAGCYIDALFSNTHAELLKLTINRGMFYLRNVVQQDIAQRPTHFITNFKFEESGLSKGAVISLFESFGKLEYSEIKDCVFAKPGDAATSSFNKVDLIMMGTSIDKLHLKVSPIAADYLQQLL
jgi:hypothetical protein